MLNKKDYIKQLETIATYLELSGENPFKISAYRKAAANIETFQGDINTLSNFTEIKGVGKGVAEVLEDIKQNGEATLLHTLKASTPQGLIQMLKIRNLGAKKIVKINDALGIEDIDALKQACIDHKVSALPGFGKKSEENILKGIEEMLTMTERLSIYQMHQMTSMIDDYLSLSEDIQQFNATGSFRRKNEFSGDIDYIIETTNREATAEFISKAPFIKAVELQGNEKITVQVERDDLITTADFRFIDRAGYAHMLQHFTGSKEHNIRIRQLAKDNNEKINEYGIIQSDGTLIQYKSEQEIYEHFNVAYIPPEMRIDGTEFEIQNQNEIITLQDIKGDIHMHTTFSDGAHSIEQMIEAAILKGYEYITITDHSKSLYVANGLSEERLLEQNALIKSFNKQYNEIDIYSGIEMDILADGSMDYSDDILKELDYVIAAIHQSLTQPEEDIMKRLTNACHNPYVRHIAHPTGRLIGKRQGYAVNIEQLIQVAQDTNTVLEINAHPMRLDLSADILRQYPDLQLTINTDAHAMNQLDLMPYGVGTAIKGRVKKNQVINTMDRAAFKEWVTKGK
ncbi:DNA polymerase/3'-5' exonuclease PolX [Macrococcus capreoli]|uniref:DNA polymerase/3'-5' exonuclease PolX n=1 Tax=Macrococcus capreoli TaxID=2982690 RepID=UPI0021D58208|nr:DNA polymerase/3'-5' exonuclease PolX [Macrococcus sp. TMW 2.2395]MCU7557107.1 DNA polymerase/3'-5' exonuclease PolX [Macrococcus sp. TMW 2.2395]